jgi:hypothetical protein
VRIDLIEKLILFLAGLAVLAVAGFVTFCSMLPGGLRSGIPKVVEDSALQTQDWLNAQRRRSGRGAAGPVTLAPGEVMYQAAPAPPPSGGAPAGGGDSVPDAPTTTAYFEASGNVPQAEQVPGFPWLRRVPGVNYASPQQVPDVLYRKYQSFEETWDLVQEGGGKFVKTNDGKDAYEINWLEENSYLASRIGLRPGDRVVSVNGQPVGQSLGAGKAMFEQLKGERRFAVLIERQGSPMVLSFYVQ